MRKIPAIIATTALLLTACGGDPGVQQTQPVSVTGTALPDYGSTVDDPAIGMMMPEVVGASFDGTEVSITNDGRPKVIVIAAHWCPACQGEVEEYTEPLGADGPPEGVDVYMVSTSPDANRQNYPPSEWLEKWPLPVLADSEEREVAAAFGLTAFPLNVFVYADGTIAARVAGSGPYEWFQQSLEFLAENPTG